MALWWIRVRCWMSVKVAENRVHSRPLGLLGFLISCGRTLHHLHCSEHRGGGGGGRERTFSQRDSISCNAEQWPATLFPISNSNAELILGGPHLSPPFFVSLSSLSLSSRLTSFAPSRLSISSHPARKSLFQFRNTLKPMPAARSPPLPRDWTLGLLTFFFLLYIFLRTVSSILHLSPTSPPHPTWPCLSRSISFSTGCIVLAWKTGFWTGVK